MVVITEPPGIRVLTPALTKLGLTVLTPTLLNTGGEIVVNPEPPAIGAKVVEPPTVWTIGSPLADVTFVVEIIDFKSCGMVVDIEDDVEICDCWFFTTFGDKVTLLDVT